MIIGCIGDVHGRAYHALAALVRWQVRRGCRFDLVVQSGDLGVLPSLQTGERPYDRFSQWDPSVYDLCDLIGATGDEAGILKRLVGQVACPILVVGGNHDEFAEVRAKGGYGKKPCPIDPHGIFSCVADGYRMEIGKAVIGFFEGDDPATSFGGDGAGIDVLVSHEGGFGDQAGAHLSAGPEGTIAFLEKAKPRFHIFGHFHHPVPPIRVHDTRCIQVSSVVSDPRQDSQVMEEGSIVALDTDRETVEFIEGYWLCEYDRRGGISLLAEALSETF